MKARRIIAFFLASVLFAYPALQPAALYALESRTDEAVQLDQETGSIDQEADSTDQEVTQGDASSADSQQDGEASGTGDITDQNTGDSASEGLSPLEGADGNTLPNSTDTPQNTDGEENSVSSSQDETSGSDAGSRTDGSAVYESGSLLAVEAHVQHDGWMDSVGLGEVAGTTGENKNLEAIRIAPSDGFPDDSNVSIRVFVNGEWLGPFSANEVAGTVGKSQAIEAIQIELTGSAADQYDVWYSVHSAKDGWSGWAKNGEKAGCSGLGKNAQAVNLRLTPKGSDAPEPLGAKTEAYSYVKVSYRAHIQKLGWQSKVSDGVTSGTTGRGLNLEKIEVELGDELSNGSVEIRAHIAKNGWGKWQTGSAGTTGRGLAVEAVQIRLSGDIVNQYDIWYRVHSAKMGWLDWACNGAPAGTSGKGYGIQAIEIRLVEKNGAAPGSTAKSFDGLSETVKVSGMYINGTSAGNMDAKEVVVGDSGSTVPLQSFSLIINNQIMEDASVSYRASTAFSGWQDAWSSDGSAVNSSSSGSGCQINAIEIKLNESLSDQYDVWYRTYIVGSGWLGWAKNGEPSGTEGTQGGIAAIQIRLTNTGSPAPGSTNNAYKTLGNSTPKVVYQTHVSKVGWQPAVSDGETAGTTGRGISIEALRVTVEGANDVSGDIQVWAHVQKRGWTSADEPVVAPTYAGTTGEKLELQAIKLKLTGELADSYDIYYRVHSAKYGWLGWAKNGEPAGTTGLSLRAEAIQIVLVNKDDSDSIPTSTDPAYISLPDVSYEAYVQSQGWMSTTANGSIVGTTGRGLRLEALRLSVSSDISGDVAYSAHVQHYGWQQEVTDGSVAGTTGEGKRVEAIKVRLTGNLKKYFDIYYRVYIDDIGWLGWAKNGDTAGTTSCSLGVQAVQITIVNKGGAAPGSTSGAYYSSLSSLPYIGYQTPGSYYKVSNKSVSIKNLGVNQFGYRTESRIPYNATREQCINAMITRAIEYTGTPYRWDYSCAPGVGVDCAGLVMQALYATGMDLTPMNPWDHYYTPGHDHYANDMRSNSRFMHVSTSQLQRGDLILYSGHVAIYLGNNTIIEAVSPRVRTVGSIAPLKPVLAVVRPFP